MDNIKVMSMKRSSHIEKIKKKLIVIFKIVDIKPISFYVSLKVKKD